jgi:excisionase family DNA binding protein
MSTNTAELDAGTAPNTERLLTKRELAALLSRSPRTVDDWLKRERLPHLKIGRAVLFRYSTVLAHLEREFGVQP